LLLLLLLLLVAPLAVFQEREALVDAALRGHGVDQRKRTGSHDGDLDQGERRPAGN
jgi:hypothetical protein